MNLFFREKYLKKMRGFYQDTDIIKVITGVRRSGKSCLMKMAKEELQPEHCLLPGKSKQKQQQDVSA